LTTRLAIFDLDGTLVDSVDDLASSVNYALALHGLPTRSREEVLGFIGNGARPLIERSVGARKELVEPVLRDWWAYYSNHMLDETRPYPGVRELLKGARRTMAVQSNKPGDMVRKILEGLGLLSHFAVVLGGGESAPKPDPAGVKLILDRTGARVEDTVFIGDLPADVTTARNAGVELVAVTWGLGSRESLVSAGATRLVDRVEDLAPWLA
jgi:phosphoglycolate phosphatase